MSQSLASILVHVIFSTKNRQFLIDSCRQPDLYSYMVGIAKSHKTFVHEIGGVEDHIHTLISLPRTLTISQLVEEIKKTSSKWIKYQGSNYANFAWQNGYGAFSIGQSNYDALQKYIQNQKVHHKNKSFQDEYRELLNKYRVPFDEKYVWD